MRQVKLDNFNGYPAIMVDGKAYPPMMATVRPDKKRVIDKDYYNGLGEGKIKIFFLLCDTCWHDKNAHIHFEQEARQLLECVPDAKIIVRIGLHPSDEWIENNPDECFTYNDGSKPAVRLYYDIKGRDLKHQYSLCSQKWRDEARGYLDETCAFMDSLPFANSIIGYFFAAGGTSEWYYSLPLEKDGLYGDFSEAFRREFEIYLTEKYKTDEAMQKAWKDESVTLKKPKIYGMDKRFFAKEYDDSQWYDDEYPTTYGQEMPSSGANIGNFVDIDNFTGMFDFYRAWHLSVARSQVFFAKFIKERYKNNMLTGSFYGSYGATDFFSCTAAGVLEILSSGAMDFLAAPGVYVNRQPGGFCGQREMNDSFRLRNTMFIVEEDTRTHMELNYFKTLFDYYDINDSIEILKRDFARNICEDLQAWWYDNDMQRIRYKHEDIYKLFAKQQDIAEKAYSKNRIKNNEIAFIYDEESVSLISNRSTKDLVEYFRSYEIARIGAGVDQYYHNDMSLDNMPDYKLYVFFNTFYLTEKERAQIHAKLSKNKAVALWVYAPGIINPDKDPNFDVRNISLTTGINMSRLDEKWPSKFRINGEAKVFKNLNRLKIYGTKDRPYDGNIIINDKSLPTHVSPVFYPDDKSASIEGYFLLNKLPAVALKDTGSFTSIYCGAKVLRCDFVREAARYAGCHIYNEQEECVYVSENYICIHAKECGKKELVFKNKCSLFEVYENKYYAKNTKKLVLNMYQGQTLMFEIIK